MSKHVGENCGKLCISYTLSSKRGITPSKIDAKRRDSNLIWSTVKQSRMQNFSSIYVKACKRKLRNTVYFLYSEFKKRHNSFKNWHIKATLELDLKYSKTKSYAKFQLSMSKHVREKCRKLHISLILSSQRGITFSKIGIWSTVKQSHMQNFSSICQSM